ncbi:MAG: pantoate--beta-alanine ligase, partial [Muribaculaceae bacterium]|nr:pantoate--beta-alanine ligase [Muribaculaceae bacterium]
MEIVRTVNNISELCARAREEGKTIGLVPTMGALHAGHVSLIDRVRKENDVVVVSVFVNPTQFNNPADLSTYPRTEEADCAKIEASAV